MRLLNLVLTVLFIVGCSHNPSRKVYSSGFSFANYDYVVISKPDGQGSTTLYGMDVEFANLLSRYNIKVVGDKEFELLSVGNKKRCLIARMSLISSSNSSNSNNLLSVSFDDAVSGRTAANFISKADGDMFDAHDRTVAFENVSKDIVKSISKEKGLTVQDSK